MLNLPPSKNPDRASRFTSIGYRGTKVSKATNWPTSKLRPPLGVHRPLYHLDYDNYPTSLSALQLYKIQQRLTCANNGLKSGPRIHMPSASGPSTPPLRAKKSYNSSDNSPNPPAASSSNSDLRTLALTHTYHVSKLPTLLSAINVRPRKQSTTTSSTVGNIYKNAPPSARWYTPNPLPKVPSFPLSHTAQPF